MYCNGILIVSPSITKKQKSYSGIERTPWPLDAELFMGRLNSSQIDAYCELISDNLLLNNKMGLIDLEHAQIYANACKACGKEYQALYIEAFQNGFFQIDQHLHSLFALNSNLLGYDVGWCSDGGYYSSLLSDVIARPYMFSEDLVRSINQNGLFDSICIVHRYLEEREQRINSSQPLMFEVGEMYPIAVYNAFL